MHGKVQKKKKILEYLTIKFQNKEIFNVYFLQLRQKRCQSLHAKSRTVVPKL